MRPSYLYNEETDKTAYSYQNDYPVFVFLQSNLLCVCHIKLDKLYAMQNLFAFLHNTSLHKMLKTIFYDISVHRVWKKKHYCDVIMHGIASQITSLTIVYSTVYSDADQRKHQSSASLAFGTDEFPAHMASNAENVSIWWRHHMRRWWGDIIFQLEPMAAEVSTFKCIICIHNFIATCMTGYNSKIYHDTTLSSAFPTDIWNEIWHIDCLFSSLCKLTTNKSS